MIENSIFISGKQEGIKQGTRRGIEENQKSIVKITGLTMQEIEKI